MIIEGDLSTDKTNILVEKYAELVNSGVNINEILVIVQNSNKKNQFFEKAVPLLNNACFEKPQIHSFFSLVYNTVQDNWVFLENLNPDNTNISILPNLAGLEVSQFILNDILNEVKFKGYNSKKSLLHQIFRRYSLIVQNNLNDDEIEWRSNVLKESFGEDAKLALKKFLSKTLLLRDFDYLRQTLLFNCIYKNTDYFKRIKYLFLDDGDEITPVCYDFIEYLSKQLNEAYIAYDKLGTSRTGYLSADKTAVWKFEELFKEKAVKLNPLTKTADDANILYKNISEQKSEKLKLFTMYSPSKRASMIDKVISEINLLTSKNVNPDEIAVITPVIDDMLKFTLKENLKKSINPLFLSGSEKLTDNKLVHAVLTILKLNTDLKNNLSEFELRPVFSDFLGIPVKYCKNILENFEEHKTFIRQDFPFEEYRNKYNKFIEFVINNENNESRMSEKVCDIFNELADKTSINVNDLNKFDFFVKQLQDFENIFKDNFSGRETDIINRTENSIISENPYTILEIGQKDLVIATPQKIIDNKIKTKYQFWLDISSDEWIKSDTGPLYNAWVFQRGWVKDEYTVNDNILLSREKTARMLRKLTLCASEQINTYSSLFDSNGIENFGGIENYIIIDEKKENLSEEKSFKITPRDDQKAVLEYSCGNLAVSAVPGAGKTFILLALIIKLLNKGICPENIFVMTYMESAARNFRDRIKNIRKNSTQLPNISTIHGLALRIIKENNNFERLGLPSDFDICDDTQRVEIVKNIADKLKLNKTVTEEFDRAVSIFKISQGVFGACGDKKIEQFKIFYEEYQKALKERNLIDYDDILISSVRLLEENPDILSYYQDICRYVAEDEAQDSSSVQQRLIKLICAKHKNLIRCGDINQAITTTFSNADVEGFRKFISDNPSVSMNFSQRCTKDVYTLANNLVRWAENNETAKNAFYKIFMNEVTGKNPICENAVQNFIFENETEERNYVINRIKNILKKDNRYTVGILLRNNYQAARWISYINDSGLKCITRSECLEQKSIFRAIHAIFKMIAEPFDNDIITQSYETLSELGFYKQRLGIEIRNYNKPFAELNCDDIENIHLARFYWDLMYWISLSGMPPEEIAIKAGLHYFSSEIEKSNVYLIATLVKRLGVNNRNFKTLVQKLEELSKKPSLSGFKFFSEEEESDKEFLSGKVQIMTLHKSKGDEFDYVFIPEMTEKNLTVDFEQIKLKSSDFIENIRRLSPHYKPKSEYDLKREILEENLRLLYVAITRAKKSLTFTVSTKSKAFNKVIDQKPSIIFDEILNTQEKIHG